MLLKNNTHKIFCIGLNKTGTTSLGMFLEQQGSLVESQRKGELLLKDYFDRNFNAIINHCKKSHSVVYQDVPFSLPLTYPHLDNAFPESKFILTIRENSDVWFESILKFHSDFYNNGKIPTYESLKNSKYVYPGWSWKLMHDVFINDKSEMYSKNEFVDVYENHVESVKNYFKNNPDKLLIIDVSKNDDLLKLCKWLKIKTDKSSFPHISSKDILSLNYNCKFLKG
ncbi:sulfotransferase [Aequorivita sp. SDUM287046]|uniref:Sulfotransferase n=1 Tax=Aequorivita aurantiaca TaxID=3053356 RepID=A0ABT8DIR9_9FLAO|nr:sulfotransferase [Aequorivita aurantiaca]MDN3725276.1 sulfotransferase [Aequorivita aurantiaca]